jgi:hypothetical protein
MVQGSDGVWRVAGAPESAATPATQLAEAQTQRALPPAATRALPPATQRALPPATQRALPPGTPAEMTQQLAQAQARQTTHFGTVSKEPIEFIQSENFRPLTSANPYDGGIPNLTSEHFDAYKLPVWEIGGKKIAFGTEGVGRFNPTFPKNDVQIIPANPYDISALSKTSVEGRQFGELYFDALDGFHHETRLNLSAAENNLLGRVPALTYAAARGDDVALKELQRLAAVGKESQLQAKTAYIEKDLSLIKDTDWENIPGISVKVGTDNYKNSIYRPVGIDDIFMTHQTSFLPEVDPVTGQRFIRPTQDFAPIDPATGKPILNPITGKPAQNPDQINIHMAANHVVEGHMNRPQPSSGGYVITGPLRDLLDANPGSLNNLQPVDSWFTPPPGEGLILPDSWRVIKTPGIDKYNYKELVFDPLVSWTKEQTDLRTSVYKQLENDIDKLVFENMQEIAKIHNQSDTYELRAFQKGMWASSNEVNDRLKFIAGKIIPEEYPEYFGGVTSTSHNATPSKYGMDIADYSSTAQRRSGLFIQDSWMLSPNAKLRYFDNNKFTTGGIIETFRKIIEGL